MISPGDATVHRIAKLARYGLLGENPRPLAKDTVFLIAFATLYLLSGALTVAIMDTYRMGLVSALVIPLVLLYGVRFDAVSLSFLALVAAIVLSAIYNATTLRDLVLFLRVPAFSFLMYYLSKLAMVPAKKKAILRWLLIIGVVQLPVVLAQYLIVRGIDAGFGTFNFETDYALGFFEIMVLIVLLFFPKEEVPAGWKMPLAWLVTLTVFTTNAQMTKLIALAVWLAYLIQRPRLIRFAKVLAIGTSVALAVQLFWSIGAMVEPPAAFLWKTPIVGDVLRPKAVKGTQEPFGDYLEGGYARVGAIRYFLSQPLNVWGDGPSKYYDAISRQYSRGNIGHIFTYYAETGAVGLLASFVTLAAIAWMAGTRFKPSFVSSLAFLCIGLLGFTNQIMNDVAVMLVYCLVCRAQLIPTDGEPAPDLKEPTG
jgi:hypothetical protein